MSLQKRRDKISAILEFLAWAQNAVPTSDIVVLFLQQSQPKRQDSLIFSYSLRYCVSSRTALEPIVVADVLAVCTVLYGVDIAMRKGDTVFYDKYDHLFGIAAGFYRPVHRLFKSKRNIAKPTLRQYTLLSDAQKPVFITFLEGSVDLVDPFAE